MRFVLLLIFSLAPHSLWADLATNRPVLLFETCSSNRQLVGAGLLQEKESQGFRVVSTLPLEKSLHCLEALEASGQRHTLRLVKLSVEAGLVEFSTSLLALPGPSVLSPSPVRIQELEVFSRTSADHLIPWLDQAWEVRPKTFAPEVLVTGSPVYDEFDRVVGLISNQKWDSQDSVSNPAEPLLLIPQDYLQRWQSLTDQGKLFLSRPEQVPDWFRDNLPLPNGLAPGLRPDPRISSGADPMGVNGELIAAASRSAHGPRADQIHNRLRNKEVLGLFVKRQGVWFEVSPKTYVKLVALLAEPDPLWVAGYGSQASHPGLQEIELQSRRLSKNLRDRRFLELALLADQVRHLAKLARSDLRQISLEKELNELTSAASPTWGPLLSRLESQSPQDFKELTRLCDQLRALQLSPRR